MGDLRARELRALKQAHLKGMKTYESGDLFQFAIMQKNWVGKQAENGLTSSGNLYQTFLHKILFFHESTVHKIGEWINTREFTHINHY
jgi:hypothetical protein